MHHAVWRLAQAFQQPSDLFEAQLHAVARAARSFVDERRGIDGFEPDAFRRKDRLHDGELIVDFIERVGVRHGTHAARAGRQHAQTVRFLDEDGSFVHGLDAREGGERGSIRDVEKLSRKWGQSELTPFSVKPYANHFANAWPRVTMRLTWVGWLM